jgi:ribosomal protein L37AE/L43A
MCCYARSLSVVRVTLPIMPTQIKQTPDQPCEVCAGTAYALFPVGDERPQRGLWACRTCRTVYTKVRSRRDSAGQVLQSLLRTGLS